MTKVTDASPLLSRKRGKYGTKENTVYFLEWNVNLVQDIQWCSVDMIERPPVMTWVDSIQLTWTIPIGSSLPMKKRTSSDQCMGCMIIYYWMMKLQQVLDSTKCRYKAWLVLCFVREGRQMTFDYKKNPSCYWGAKDTQFGLLPCLLFVWCCVWMCTYANQMQLVLGLW